MKAIILTTAFVLALGSQPAFAVSCTTGTELTKLAVANLLSGKYACVGTPPTASWNELHNGTATASGGSVIDYKLGPSHATDPTKTVGTYSITGQAIGTVTYTYSGGGGTYSYTIRNNQGGTLGASGTGTYSFCGASGGSPNLDVKVQASNC